MKKIEKIDKAAEVLSRMTDEDLLSMKFSMPWQMDAKEDTKDADGFPEGKFELEEDRTKLQKECWRRFNKSPFVGTSIRGQVGRLTGFGFEISSEIFDIQEAIEETELDPRNRLFSNWTKFVGRSNIEGELFLTLTPHKDGFIEVDLIDPSWIKGGDNEGIMYHPTKSCFPLFYSVNPGSSPSLIPSINLAYYPDLIGVAKKDKMYVETQTKDSRSSKNIYNKLGGFSRFIVSWDRSMMTKRNVSHLRTVLEWLNHYENLKKYEIDHKKSAGSYLWIITMEDPKAFRRWLELSDEDRRKTGIMAKKTPGSTLVLPPGMKAEAVSPKLPTISDTDTDILHLVTGGLNEPEDISTGQSKGTFASVKASRGPMSDRISDEIAYFERFLRFDFYRAVFFLKSAVSDFQKVFSVRTAIDFKDQKPVFKDVNYAPEKLLDISFPVSEMIDSETRARAFLGVKHGSVYDVLGIPNKEIAKKIGFGNYRRLRLQQATEEDRFPELQPPVDAGGQQAEPVKKEPIQGRKAISKKTE